MDNNQTLLDFWRDHQWPDPEPVLFRLYHDDQGRPLCYSQQQLPETYIDITPEQWQRADFRVRVVDGKIEPLPPPPLPRLMPSDSGTPCHPQDVTVIVPDGPAQKWRLCSRED